MAELDDPDAGRPLRRPRAEPDDPRPGHARRSGTGTGPGGRWHVLAGDCAGLLDPAPGMGVAAVLVPSADGLVDPPALAVHADALALVGGPEPVRAGALADLVARLAATGQAIEVRHLPVPRRRPTVGALLREGAGRFWLWRRWPDVHPLPRPARVGLLRYPLLTVGALHANGEPTRPDSQRAGRAT